MAILRHFEGQPLEEIDGMLHVAEDIRTDVESPFGGHLVITSPAFRRSVHVGKQFDVRRDPHAPASVASHQTKDVSAELLLVIPIHIAKQPFADEEYRSP